METMKRKWLSPVSGVQKFVPQYCQSPCIHKETDTVTWVATCMDSQSLIFYNAGDSHGGGGDWSWDTSRGGCGKSHPFEMSAGAPITSNCLLLEGISQRNWNSNYASTVVPGVHNHDLWVQNGGRLTHELKEQYRGLLVEGYYNDQCLDGGSWLVTDDLMSIHIVS